MSSPTLILASTSAYRRQLLDRLGLAYVVDAPSIDEARLANEAPDVLAQRLAFEKAQAVAQRHPHAWVIGSDQVADCDGTVLGKPGEHARAVDQLRRASGRQVRFHTAVCLRQFDSKATLAHCDLTTVAFRELPEDSIQRYLLAERPYDCAGSFKSEGLGISLFESVRSEDPTALIGLPLIAVARMLREAGFRLP